MHTVQEQARLHSALCALRVLARKYEFRDETERAPMGAVVEATFPSLLRIFQVGAPLYLLWSSPLRFPQGTSGYAVP